MTFNIGDFVFVTTRLPYLKTADPVPMLRPPDLLSPGEVGKVVALRSQGVIEVRFRRGNFLVPIDRLSSSGSDS